MDPLLAGLSQEAARIVDPAYVVNPACNFYFMAVSTVLIAGAGTVVTEKLVEPRLGRYNGSEETEPVGSLSAEERRGLRFAAIAGLVFTAFLLAGTIPANGFLRDAATGDLLHSPFINGVVALIFLGAVALGVAAAHERGIVHRDISPSNVLISIHGDVKIADFGIALALVHAAVLMIDRSVPYTPFEVVIPFAGPYRPLWVGIGQLTMGLALVVMLSFYVRKRLGPRA